MIAQTDTWPELRYDAYSDTRDTLHMYSQIIGKIRLALTPPLAQWAHSPLLLAQDGFTTTPLWVGDGTMAAGLDLIRHEARFERSDGRRVALKLGAPVADFYSDARAALDELGVAVTINAVPQEIPEPIPFDQDTTHHVYDPEQANRLWQAMIRVGSVLRAVRERLLGQADAAELLLGRRRLRHDTVLGPAGDGSYWPAEDHDGEPRRRGGDRRAHFRQRCRPDACLLGDGVPPAARHRISHSAAGGREVGAGPRHARRVHAALRRGADGRGSAWDPALLLDEHV